MAEAWALATKRGFVNISLSLSLSRVLSHSLYLSPLSGQFPYGITEAQFQMSGPQGFATNFIPMAQVPSALVDATVAACKANSGDLDLVLGFRNYFKRARNPEKGPDNQFLPYMFSQQLSKELVWCRFQVPFSASLFIMLSLSYEVSGPPATQPLSH